MRENISSVKWKLPYMWVYWYSIYTNQNIYEQEFYSLMYAIISEYLIVWNRLLEILEMYKKGRWHSDKEFPCWASPGAQWEWICLPMQDTRVWSLVQEDATCCGAAGAGGLCSRAQELQLPKPTCPKAPLHSKRTTAGRSPDTTAGEQARPPQPKRSQGSNHDPAPPKMNK